MKLIKILAMLGAGFLGWFYLETKHLTVKSYSFTSEKIPEAFSGMRIAVVADLHNNIFGKENRRLLDLLERENPDIVLVAGDMVVGREDEDFTDMLGLLKRISVHFPVYYAFGNHECRTEKRKLNEYKKAVKKAGIHLLQNEKMALERAGEQINIYGLEIDMKYYKRKKPVKMEKEYLDELLGVKKENEISILIAHDPEYFEAYAGWGADLTVSGHYHGGIVRLPFLGGMVSPRLELFPEYDAGLYKKKDKVMVLSAGLGSHTLHFRAFNPPELVMITMEREPHIAFGNGSE